MVKTIQSDRLEIKAFSERDLEELSGLLQNEHIKKTFMIPDFTDEEELMKMVNALLSLSRSDKHFTRGIYLRDRLIGFVNDVEVKDTCIELGYVIHPSFWGNGYATEMLNAVIRKLLGDQFTTIRAGAFRENAASIRVMEKCGMCRCSQMEEISYRGTVHSCVYYEINV